MGRKWSLFTGVDSGTFTYIEGSAPRSCSQSPIFPSDRRERARLTVNGGHLDFKCTESDLGKSIKSA